MTFWVCVVAGAALSSLVAMGWMLGVGDHVRAMHFAVEAALQISLVVALVALVEAREGGRR